MKGPGTIVAACLLVVQAPVVNATVLGDIADSMQPGEFRNVTADTGETGSSMTSMLGAGGVRTYLEYAIKGHWDPTRQLFAFSGSPHADSSRRHITYDAISNDWSYGNSWPSQGHNYDMETIDPATGDFYRREKGFGANKFYRLPGGGNPANSGSWTELNLPGPDQTSSSMEWFPEIGGIVLNSGNRGLQVWNGSSWTLVSEVIKDGDTNHWTVYNSVRGEMLFGPKSKSSLKAYTLSSNLNVKQVDNVPLRVGPGSGGSGSGVIAADPATGNYVLIERDDGNGRVFESPDGDNWTEVVSNHPINKISGWMIGTAIDTYGVIMIIAWNQGDSSVWLYKHAECSGNCVAVDNVAPKSPTDLGVQ